jgi:hypothetical protein
MTQGVQDLIKAIDSGDSQTIDAAFQAEMANRISTRLEDLRVSVAQNMFATEQTIEETEVEEELTLEDYSIEELEEFMQTEDFEQLDELTASTLTSYVKKAGSSLDKSHNAANKAYKKYDDTDDDKDIAAGDKAHATYNKRHAGMSTALKKLSKKANDSALGEEAEQIDELSPKTLGSYHKKARLDADKKASNLTWEYGIHHGRDVNDAASEDEWDPETKRQAKGEIKHMNRRTKGMDLAVKKLVKKASAK